MSARMRDGVARFLVEQAGAQRVEIRAVTLLSGGAIQQNWLFDLSINGGSLRGRHDMVLRTDSAARISVSHGREHEFRLLEAAFAAEVAVPEPLFLCSDPAYIGKPFYLMRRVGGTALGQTLVKEFGPEGSRAGDGDALVARLGAELARIHGIAPPKAEFDFLPPPPASPALDAVARYRAYLDTQAEPHPALEWGLRWCERAAPPAGDTVLCHRDFRTGNYMVGEAGLTGILDWEFAGWGDPVEDIGWFCARCWRFGAFDREAGGIGARAAFYAGYERIARRKIDPARVAFWETMAHIRWAVIALQQAARHLSGEEPSLALALTGHRLPELEFEILRATEAA